MRTKHNKKKRLFVVCALILAAGGLIIRFALPKKNKKTELPPIIVKKEVSSNKIEIDGYIEAAQVQTLQAPGEGIVETVAVKEGGKVRAGDLLFALDSTVQEYNLAQQNFAFQQEAVNGPSKKLKLMEQQKKLLEKQIADRKVYARFDGTVALLKIREGQYAKAQDNFGTLINREYLQSTVEVVESDASRLKVGQRVQLKFPAQPDLKVEAEITAFPSVARITERGAAVLDTKIRINEPPESILPGYSFSGFIVAGEDEEILTIPQNAVRYKEGVPFADKIADGKTEEVEISVEPYIRGFLKITSGLSEGDTLKDQSEEG
ncbi:efflux RND transporter periplasmic adaptor subunit [Treponema sp. OMZ 840]|uniref:efflux RND transporter periplasmic adaptor subunit n=1 Tax=Treponema sp. OMZ 840 TaxID=244313 RepID=UPI003D946085